MPRMSNAERQAAYRQRMKDRGFVQIAVEIPVEMRSAFLLEVARARSDHLRKTGQQDD